MDFYPAPLRGGDRDASPGAGKEAERRYQSPAWKAYRLHPSLSETPFADLGFHPLSWFFRAPGRTVSPAGRDRPAPWKPRKRFRGRGRELGSRVSSGAKRRASHGDRKENDRPRPPVSDEGGDRRLSGHHGAGERSVRVFMRSRSRLRISPRTGASERSEVAPGAGKETLNRRAEAVSAQRLSADGPEHQTKADGRSVRGFLRSRSRPWKRPRTGSRSEATSAGTGQSKGDFSLRGAPVAAKRSSGATRRQEGSPRGAEGSGCKSPDGGDAERGPGGRLQPRGRAGEYRGGSGAPSRQGATPRRDPGDCNAATILMESPRSGASEQSEAAPGNGAPWEEGSRRGKAVAAKRASADGLNWFFVAVVIIKRKRPETTRHLFAG